MTPLCIQTVPSVLCLMYVMKDAFNGPDCGEWGHLLIIPAKWWQLVMWEELNDSIMHQTLGRFEKKKRGHDNRLNMFESENICILCGRCQNECFSNVFWQRVLSLYPRVISFLTLCPWPAARSGFWSTMNMADGRVRQREGQGEGRGVGGGRQPLTHNIVLTAKSKKTKQNWNVGSKYDLSPIWGRHVLCLVTRKPSLTPGVWKWAKIMIPLSSRQL